MASESPQQPDGFGFKPGELIPTAPYIFEGEEQLCYVLEFAAEFGDYIPVIGWIVALVAEIVDAILQLIDELVLLFTGKPRAQDTLTVAGRLARGVNPAATLMAVQIHRNLSQNNIVLSSSTAADQKILGAIRKQGEAMLVAQGATQARAAQVVDNVWSQTTSKTQPLPVELNSPLPSGLTLVGTTAQQALYVEVYNKAIQNGDDPQQAAKKATNALLQHSKLGDLGKMFVHQLPLPNLPQPQKCPPGYIWNADLGTCVPAPNQNPCPPGQVWNPVSQTCVPSTSPTPCFPTNQDGQGDELTDGLNCVAQNLAILASAIPAILAALGQGGANPDPVTCTQITTQVALITAQLADIAIALQNPPAGGSTPIDLTPIVTALTQLVVTVAAIPAASAALGDVLVAPLNSIALSIAKGNPIDLTPIVQQLAAMVGQGDVDQAIFDALQQQGLLSPADVQTLQGIKWSDAVSYVTSSAPVRAVEKFITRAGADADTVAGWLKAKLAPAENWAEAKITGALTTERNGIQDVLSPVLSAVVSALKPAGATQLGVIGVNPDTVLADVAAVSFNLYVITALVGLLSTGAAEQLGQLVEVVTGLIGFEELKEVQIGPLVENGIARIAQMQARALFKQELPGTSSMTGWVARGLMTAARAQALAQFNGTPDELYPIIAADSYRGLNARQMLRLVETDLFSSDEIADELTFAAMRPVSQARMLKAAPYLATASQRTALVAEIQAAAVAGLFSDGDVTAQVDSAESSSDRDALILARVHLQQLVAETKALETEYVTLFKANLIDDPTLRANLAGIGLQPFMVNIVAAKAEAQASATLARQMAAAEKQLIRATVAKERQDAMKAFTTGTIDAAALAIALVATGLTTTQAAAWVGLAELQKAGSLRWTYGLQLAPAQATLLRQRVAALTNQLKSGQITPDAMVSSLKALGIGDAEVNGLVAAASATAATKPVAAYIPVKTS